MMLVLLDTPHYNKQIKNILDITSTMPYTLKKSIFAPEKFPELPNIQGLSLSVGHTGFRYENRNDLLCVRFDEPATTGAVFTKSSMPSAPIDYSKGIKDTDMLVVNAGNANAFTGKAGKQTCQDLAETIASSEGIDATKIFQASTGVIGEKLDGKALGKIAIQTQSPSDFEAAAKAIMTTDTFHKGSGVTIEIDNKPVHISGIAKGSGMIAPNMGTMLAFVFTDAEIEHSLVQVIVKEITDQSFNIITVDGDTSTSDVFAVFATGKSGVQIQNPDQITVFKQALNTVATDLALQIVKDGEGITKFVTITVDNAMSNESARAIGLSIANSPLVKTAISGQDANWGRIIMAIGKSKEPADRDLTSVSIGGFTIAQDGEAVTGYDETPVQKHMEGKEISIHVSVGVGKGKATVYTTDLSHDYIDINADYRS